MLLPVRCFTCNKLLAGTPFERMRQGGENCKDILDKLQITRLCCRRMFITYPSALEGSLLAYPAVNSKDESMFLDIEAHVMEPRVVVCE